MRAGRTQEGFVEEEVLTLAFKHRDLSCPPGGPPRATSARAASASLSPGHCAES